MTDEDQPDVCTTASFTVTRERHLKQVCPTLLGPTTTTSKYATLMGRSINERRLYSNEEVELRGLIIINY